MTATAIAGLQGHERWDWIAKSDDGLPDWLQALRATHAAALDEYLKSVTGVVNTSAQIEADARLHRRAIRTAVEEGRTPPVREHDSDVDDAQRSVAIEDSQYARAELAEVACSVLAVIREHRADFDERLYLGASPELRVALGGFAEHERLRIERQKNIKVEPDIVDLSNPLHDQYTKLGQKEAVNAA